MKSKAISFKGHASLSGKKKAIIHMNRHQCRSKEEVGGGASTGTRPRAQALGTHHHTFCSHLKTRLKKFRPKYA